MCTMAVPDEDIAQAMKSRGAEIRRRRNSLTPKQVRRMIEEDLELPTKALDDKKDFIRSLIDEAMEEEEEAGEDDDEEEEEKVVKKQPAKRRATKAPPKAKKESSKKKRRKDEEEEEEDEDSDGQEEAEDEDSEEDVRRAKKRSEKKAPAPRTPKVAYGKRVEKLKDVIKQCGMVVPPNIYKKANQASADKREDLLVSELEAFLEREGLSSNPSEKEIKECKARKQKLKELEGIELDNIIDVPRGRRAARQVMSYKVPDDDDEDEEEKDDAEDEDDDDDDEDVEPEEDEDSD
eukprot:TRINITY_DN3980_c0_g1_i1.p1 TRINITY_DN3980_c0_g1~~TRINITY_DN3980_c0_g1_i1.p1  ORF type:complete len:292 (-),score=133.72 TRINITY_DN3980_c0_g1_i1:372-1247(-)